MQRKYIPFPEDPGDITVFTDCDRIEREYAIVVNKLWDMEDVDGHPDDIDALYHQSKALQQSYMDRIRGFRDRWMMWLDRDHVKKRSRIELIPGRCRAEVSLSQQCSRRATMRLGDLDVCTQHFKLINNDADRFAGPDLFSRDGLAYAGHAVLESFPGPWLWEHIPLD